MGAWGMGAWGMRHGALVISHGATGISDEVLGIVVYSVVRQTVFVITTMTSDS